MSTIAPSPAPAAAPVRRLPAIALTLLLATLAALALTVWLPRALPFIRLEQKHYGPLWDVAPIMLAHAALGIVPLLTGALLLWSGLQRVHPRLHRWTGRVYMVTGGAMAIAGLVLSVFARNEPRSLYVSTFTLGVVWLIAAAMAWRAIRNRRIEQHKDWVIRSYVLSFSFVACRLAMELPMIRQAGPEAVTATIWAMWITPLILAEVALQWRRGSRLSAGGG